MVALFNRSDHYHKATLEFVKHFRGKFHTTLANITETVYLLDFSRDAQIAFLEWVGKGGIKIESVHEYDILNFIKTFQKYSDLPMDFADACMVILAETHDWLDIATIDKDFHIYRINGSEKFRVHISEA